MYLVIHRHPVRARLAAWALACAALLAVAGCAGSPRQVVRRELLCEFTPEQRTAIESAESAPYRLQRGDLFAVETLVDEELRQDSIIVLPDGSASFADLGNVVVEGRTIAEVEQTLNEAYSRNYRDVALSVVLKKVVARQVYVLGEVRNPGLYDVTGRGIGIMGAIAQAGGFSDWAGHASVVVMRLTADGYFIRELDLTALRKGSEFDAAAVDLQPYDIVYVNRSKIGDFAAFSKNVMTSLVQYSRFILDARQIEDPEIYRR